MNPRHEARPVVDRLLGELRDGPVLLSARAELEARRQRVLPALREHVGKLPQRRRRARIRNGLLAASGAIASLFGVWFGLQQASPEREWLLLEPQGSATLITRGEQTPESLSEALQVVSEGELEVSQRAALTTPSGIDVQLGERTRVGLDALVARDGKSELLLVSGRVECSVPPLGQSRSFSVVAANTRVVVHGTRFSVEARGADERACVRVSEGLVAVHHGAARVMLYPGEHWGCEPEPARGSAAAPESATVAATEVSTVAATEAARVAATEQKSANRSTTRSAGSAAARAASVAAAPAAPPAAAPATGTLAEETRLMSLALSAERRGQRALAAKQYAEIVARYPDSPLAPEARRGLTRVR